MTMNSNESGIITIGNFQLHYSIEGKGQDALVIGSSIYYPRTFSQNLRNHLRLGFIDHRGFAKKPENLTGDQYALNVILDDIETMRKKLGFSRIPIIGHSGHGYMALEYAKKYPDSVSHIILIAMSPNGSSENFEAADRYFQESVCPERKNLLSSNLASLQTEIDANPNHAFITRALKFGPMIWYNPKFDASSLWHGVNVIPEIMDHLWGEIFREIDITKGLKQLNVPVFLGLGRYDYWNPPYLWEKVRPFFSDLTIRVFEKSGHTPQLEEPEAFDYELLQWMSSKHTQE